MQELIYGNEIFNIAEANRRKAREEKRRIEKRRREEKVNNIGTIGVVSLIVSSSFLMVLWWLVFGYL